METMRPQPGTFQVVPTPPVRRLAEVNGKVLQQCLKGLVLYLVSIPLIVWVPPHIFTLYLAVILPMMLITFSTLYFRIKDALYYRKIEKLQEKALNGDTSYLVKDRPAIPWWGEMHWEFPLTIRLTILREAALLFLLSYVFETLLAVYWIPALSEEANPNSVLIVCYAFVGILTPPILIYANYLHIFELLKKRKHISRIVLHEQGIATYRDQKLVNDIPWSEVCFLYRDYGRDRNIPHLSIMSMTATISLGNAVPASHVVSRMPLEEYLQSIHLLHSAIFARLSSVPLYDFTDA